MCAFPKYLPRVGCHEGSAAASRGDASSGDPPGVSQCWKRVTHVVVEPVGRSPRDHCDAEMVAGQIPNDDKHIVAPVQVDALIKQTDDVSVVPVPGVNATGEDSNKRQDKTLGHRIDSARLQRLSLSVTRVALDEAETFFRVFGYFGLPMVAVFVFSALWTFTLAFIQVYPNEMANAIMNTTQFDDGQFWLLPQPDTPTVGIAVVLLVLFGVGYLWLAFYMVIYFRRVGLSIDDDNSTDQTKHADKAPKKMSAMDAKLAALNHWVHHHILDLTPVQRHYFVRVACPTHISE